MLLLGNAYCLKLEFLCYDLQHEILVLRSHTFKYKVWILIAFGIKKKKLKIYLRIWFECILFFRNAG